MAGCEGDSRARERRTARTALAVGAAAFAGPAVLAAVAGDDGPALCPFRVATGLPCPFCGGTRAMAAAARGDLGTAFSYHGVWPIVAVLLVLAGAGGVAAARTGRTPLTDALGRLARWARPRSWRRRAAVAVLVAVPWGIALAHRDAITERGETRAVGRVEAPGVDRPG
jgi:hypothetical protein